MLYSLASDLSSALDMPQDDASALDHLAAEMGFEKPGEALRTLRALRLAHDDVTAFLRKVGIARRRGLYAARIPMQVTMVIRPWRTA